MPAPQPVCLAADDYGYRPGVSRAIRELARAGRITATGALVTFTDWERAGREVAALREHADVGLHLDLVEGRPLGRLSRLAPDGRFPGLGTLAARALAGRLDAGEIADETRRQIDRFVAVAGVAPDFLDGHRHAHALPAVRDAVLGALEASGLGGLPVRDPGDRIARILARRRGAAKAAVIAGLARGFKPRLAARGFRSNDGFAGVYDLEPSPDLPALYRAFLAAPGPRHLVMCHPGELADDEEPDPIGPARVAEFEFLRSDAFPEALDAAAVRLVRFSDLVGAQ
jgi:predicted glycoside hydrolase/deacetylase ChbG (UPF0249 family)